MTATANGALSLLNANRLLGHSPEDLSKLLAQRLGATSPASNVAPQTQNAVTPVEDPVDIDPVAQSASDLQAIIDRLNSATDGDGIVDALGDLKEFISENTEANFAGNILGKLGDMVDTALDAIGDNPDASRFIGISVNAHFDQKSMMKGDYGMSKMNFSFSFDLQTEDTHLSADISYRSKEMNTPGSYQFKSRESVRISIQTTNASLDDNPLLSGFSDMVSQLQNLTAAQLLGLPAPTDDTPPALPPADGNVEVPALTDNAAPATTDETATDEPAPAPVPAQPTIGSVIAKSMFKMRARFVTTEQNEDATQRSLKMLTDVLIRIRSHYQVSNTVQNGQESAAA